MTSRASAILKNLARREKALADAVAPPASPSEDLGAKVDLSDEVDRSAIARPAGVSAEEWTSWSEEARYAFLERMGVGDELGMAETASARYAMAEARMEDAGVSESGRALVALAMEHFEDLELVQVERTGEG